MCLKPLVEEPEFSFDISGVYFSFQITDLRIDQIRGLCPSFPQAFTL